MDRLGGGRWEVGGGRWAVGGGNGAMVRGTWVKMSGEHGLRVLAQGIEFLRCSRRYVETVPPASADPDESSCSVGFERIEFVMVAGHYGGPQCFGESQRDCVGK